MRALTMRASSDLTSWPFVPLALLAVSLLNIAALWTTTLVGPTSLASMRLSWALLFLALLAASSLWWAGYFWLLGRLGGRSWSQSLNGSLPPLALLSLSLLPVVAAYLSGKLPYLLTFDPDTQSLYRWVASAILGATAAAQELVLLLVVREERPRDLARAAFRSIAGALGWLVRLPREAVRQALRHPFLALLLMVGVAIRMIQIDEAHPGDMNVLLSAVYATLGWPPFGYYHAYRPQPWVYNHLPLFPLMLAPFYWLFENLLHLPTAWAAKLLIDLADLAVALLLYLQVGGHLRHVWGLLLAGAWLLAPWVLAGDDHPIAPAAAFALAAFATRERGWLCGLLLALGVATRNEVAFFVLPLALHFASRRGLAQSGAFLGVFGTTLALVAAPFLLTDPEALDYALRRQIQRDASTELSALSALLLPYLDHGARDWLQQNPGALAVGFNLLIAPLALRDRRVLGVVVVAATGYLLTLPVMHSRYTLFTYAAGLFYAARYGNPLVAAASVAAVWPEFVYGSYALIGLFVGFVAKALVRLGKR